MQPAGHASLAQDADHAVWRRRAAQACLGGRADAPRESPHRVMAPMSLPTMQHGQTAPAKVPPPTPAPAMRPNLPAVLTNCDSSGCWASNGTRLNRVGPTLTGPGGICSINGTAVRCP